MSDGPLRGVRVADLTTERGAYGAMLLASLGADVVRVEPPEGDPMRALPPFLDDTPGPERSLAHWAANAGKRSVIASLDTDDGRALVRQLVASADVLIESHDPGTLAGAGLGYSDLASAQPGLVYVSISPFGQDGPWRSLLADDLVLCALGGMMGVCGDPGRPPLVAFGQQTYHTAGTMAAVNTLAALRARRISGRGQHLDVAIEACVAAFIEHVNVFYLYSGSFAGVTSATIPKRQNGLHWSLGFQVCRTADGYALLSLFHQWEALVAWLAADAAADDLTDPKYDSPLARRTDVGHVIEVVARWAATKSSRGLFDEGQLRRFPFGSLQTFEDLIANPQLRERGFFRDVPHPHLGRDITFPGPPFRLMGMDDVPQRAPLPGEHTEAVVRELRRREEGA